MGVNYFVEVDGERYHLGKKSNQLAFSLNIFQILQMIVDNYEQYEFFLPALNITNSDKDIWMSHLFHPASALDFINKFVRTTKLESWVMPVPHLNPKKFIESLKVLLKDEEIVDEYGTPLTTTEFFETMNEDGMDDVSDSTVEAYKEKTTELPRFQMFKVGKYRCCSSKYFS